MDSLAPACVSGLSHIERKETARSLKPSGYHAAKASSVTWMTSPRMSSAETPGVQGKRPARAEGELGLGEVPELPLLEAQPFSDCSSGVLLSLVPSRTCRAFQLVPAVFSSAHAQCGWNWGLLMARCKYHLQPEGGRGLSSGIKRSWETQGHEVSFQRPPSP